MKATVITTMPSGKTKSGDVITAVVCKLEDGTTKNYKTFHKRGLELKEGEEIEFTEALGKEYNGVKDWIMNFPDENRGSYQGKGGYRPSGKSPEEIETNKRTMIMSYAKDIGIKMYEKSDGKLSVTDVMDNVCEAYNRMMFVVNGPVEKTVHEPF